MTYLIRQMGHVVISSPDPLGAAKDICDVVGLRITEQDGDTVYLSSNDRHHELTYIKGDGKAVACGLEAVSADAVDEVKRRALSDGLTVLDDKPLGKHYDKAVRIVAPGGAIFEVHTPIARNQPRRYNYSTPGARPRRIEHINAFAPDTHAFGEFCAKVLGMKLSDMTGEDGLRWYRAEDGFHHTIAMGPGESGLHHYAFDLHSLEDLAAIADNLTLKDRAMVWGRAVTGPEAISSPIMPTRMVAWWKTPSSLIASTMTRPTSHGPGISRRVWQDAGSISGVRLPHPASCVLA